METMYTIQVRKILYKDNFGTIRKNRKQVSGHIASIKLNRGNTWKDIIIEG